MRRTIGKLTAKKVEHLSTPGRYADGGGLYLQVSSAGARSWIFRYWVPERDADTGVVRRNPTTGKLSGTSREMGLGSASVVSLADAREQAAGYRRQRNSGLDRSRRVAQSAIRPRWTRRRR